MPYREDDITNRLAELDEIASQAPVSEYGTEVLGYVPHYSRHPNALLDHAIEHTSDRSRRVQYQRLQKLLDTPFDDMPYHDQAMVHFLQSINHMPIDPIQRHEERTKRINALRNARIQEKADIRRKWANTKFIKWRMEAQETATEYNPIWAVDFGLEIAIAYKTTNEAARYGFNPYLVKKAIATHRPYRGLYWFIERDNGMGLKRNFTVRPITSDYSREAKILNDVKPQLIEVLP